MKDEEEVSPSFHRRMDAVEGTSRAMRVHLVNDGSTEPHSREG